MINPIRIMRERKARRKARRKQRLLDNAAKFMNGGKRPSSYIGIDSRFEDMNIHDRIIALGDTINMMEFGSRGLQRSNRVLRSLQKNAFVSPVNTATGKPFSTKTRAYRRAKFQHDKAHPGLTRRISDLEKNISVRSQRKQRHLPKRTKRGDFQNHPDMIAYNRARTESHLNSDSHQKKVSKAEKAQGRRQLMRDYGPLAGGAALGAGVVGGAIIHDKIQDAEWERRRRRNKRRRARA